MGKRKETETKFNKLPANTIDFIKLVIDKMGYRKKVRQDVQAELMTHFEDGLKNCASDKDKKQKAEKLITEFGDVKLLAVLLRRAKKRCRPLWRTVIARTFQTIGILILCFIIYTVWFLTGKPAISVDYLNLLNQMSRPQVRNEDNAWPYYEKAINLYIEPVKGGVVEEFIKYRNTPSRRERVIRFTDLSEDEQAQILQWIQQNQKHWDNLTAEQQKVVLKCFQFNLVPVFRGFSAPLYHPFELMTKRLIEVIKQKETVMDSRHASVAPEYVTGLPDEDLIDWIKENKIPPNFFESVSVAVLHEWMKRYKDLSRPKQAVITNIEYEYLGPWIKSNEAAWQEFKAGSSKSYCYVEYRLDSNKESKTLFDIVTPSLLNFRNLARLGIWYCRINLKDGKINQALEDCLAVARAGGHLQVKGTIVEQLVGTSINALAHNQILNILATTDIPTNDLKQVQQQLSEVYTDGFPLMNMEGERLMFLDIVQHVFTDGGPGGGHLVPDRLSRWMDNENDFEMWRELKLLTPLSTAVCIVHARRDETLAKVNEIYDHHREIAKITPYKRRVHKMIHSEDMIYALPRYRYFLIHHFMPTAERASEIVYRGKAVHESTVTILALKRWRLENNEYPESLNGLVTAGYLKELPMDPFSDKPLVYKRTDDDFILYSFSYNLTDDDGEHGKDREGRVRQRRWGDNGDAVFWPVLKENEQAS